MTSTTITITRWFVPALVTAITTLASVLTAGAIGVCLRVTIVNFCLVPLLHPDRSQEEAMYAAATAHAS